ncbi:hypothetical protein HYDPIDRAFT_117594 [Hydnomerulius pinastri MD-312]|uniref:Heterokaryon incompatibility domain-containing protein n=1 Tax=Hydnomerulius pinastri MD-312 TaxID=994086 RepID=A0A0C9W2D7_9AGAM|nr:hypothetical protein HYDPIDRAFT_117594 [Hydnomerulius pinastri MD-312]
MDVPYPDEIGSERQGELSESTILSWFDEYLFNHVPAHLIYVPKMKLISQSELISIVNPKSLVSRFLSTFPKSSAASREDIVEQIIKPAFKYAIFSHRWLREGEITYQDMISRTMSRKLRQSPGYKKLAYGCQFAWADTCCIDKTSSTELDEAIRSMFRWYQDAEVCVVHLAGTTGLSDIATDPWFTRGWTLQELLAPRAIKFYVSGWSPLTDATNDKANNEFVDLISTITRIPSDSVRAYQPTTDLIHQKMVWASQRKTTKTEDIAYSLLGIFDVSIPVAYGEGDRAFFRLTEAILQKCADPEVFAWSGPHSRHSRGMAIPRSPRCYYPLGVELGFRNRGDKHFVLTRQGVRIQLLLVQGTLHAVPNSSARRFHPVGFMGQQSNPVDIEAVIPETELDEHRWALGVINYEAQAPELYPEQSYLCFLLRCRFGRDQSWTKVNTSLAVILRTTHDYKHVHKSVKSATVYV